MRNPWHRSDLGDLGRELRASRPEPTGALTAFCKAATVILDRAEKLT